MSSFKVTPETTAHAFTMLDTVAIATEQLRAAVLHADARIAELEQFAKDWESAWRGSDDVIKSIGEILRADVPRELVTAVAHQRMERIAELEKTITDNIEIMNRREVLVDELRDRVRELEVTHATAPTAGAPP